MPARTDQEETCGKILHSNQRRKKNPITRRLTSCQNADLTWMWLSGCRPLYSPPTSSCPPLSSLEPLLCIAVQSHGHISAIIRIFHYCMTIPDDSLRHIYLGGVRFRMLFKLQLKMQIINNLIQITASAFYS